MSVTASPQEAMEQAATALAENRPAHEVLALVEGIAEGQPLFAQAQYVRGICAARLGDAERAKTVLIDAIRRGERSRGVWIHLASAASRLGMPDDALSMLLKLLRDIPPQDLFPFARQLLGGLGFNDRTPRPEKNIAFSKLLLPILSLLLDRREMDNALAFEAQLYERYIKPTETEAHFAWCMERISPPFTAAGHALRDQLPPLPQPPLTPPYKVGFFMHSASMLAHVEVLLNALKGYRMLGEQPFEPVVYCFSGKSREMERALADRGVRLVMLNERFPETQRSHWQRLLRFRELLSHDGVQNLVWLSLVTMMPLAFAMRLAPVQTWFAMKYKNFSHDDIDGYVMGSALTRFRMHAGRHWRMVMLGVDDWYDPSVEAQAAALRAPFAGRVVLMTLARTEKMHDPAYLRAVAAILKAHPEAVFLWAGREESPAVVQAFRAAGVLEQTQFIGWVDTRVYAQVGDIFLDSFPFPCGFTLFQAMAAGQAAVIYDSPEAAQTGLWNFLQPLMDGDEGTASERAQLRVFTGDDANPLIPVARSPEDYVRHTSRLIRDAEARAKAGAACRGLIAHYFSDPRDLGASLAEHLVEMIEERRAQA